MSLDAEIRKLEAALERMDAPCDAYDDIDADFYQEMLAELVRLREEREIQKEDDEVLKPKPRKRTRP